MVARYVWDVCIPALPREGRKDGNVGLAVTNKTWESKIMTSVVLDSLQAKCVARRSTRVGEQSNVSNTVLAGISPANEPTVHQPSNASFE